MTREARFHHHRFHEPSNFPPPTLRRPRCPLNRSLMAYGPISGGSPPVLYSPPLLLPSMEASVFPGLRYPIHPT